jgi:tetraacyldisaccharide-1-P 4'-kinase
MTVFDIVTRNRRPVIVRESRLRKHLTLPAGPVRPSMGGLARADALVALLAQDMASAMASEMGKDVSEAAKQALRRLGQRLRREPDTRAAIRGRSVQRT